MAEASAGAVSRQLDHLRTLLSESAAFQAACGVASAAAALPRIVRGYAEPGEVDEGGAAGTRAMPFAALEMDSFVYGSRFDDGLRGAPVSGRFTLVVWRVWNPAAGASGSQRPADEYVRFVNLAGQVVEEMFAADAGRAGRVMRLTGATVGAIQDGEEELGESATGERRRVGQITIQLEVSG